MKQNFLSYAKYLKYRQAYEEIAQNRLEEIQEESDDLISNELDHCKNNTIIEDENDNLKENCVKNISGIGDGDKNTTTEKGCNVNLKVCCPLKESVSKHHHSRKSKKVTKIPQNDLIKNTLEYEYINHSPRSRGNKLLAGNASKENKTTSKNKCNELSNDRCRLKKTKSVTTIPESKNALKNKILTEEKRSKNHLKHHQLEIGDVNITEPNKDYMNQQIIPENEINLNYSSEINTMEKESDRFSVCEEFCTSTPKSSKDENSKKEHLNQNYLHEDEKVKTILDPNKNINTKGSQHWKSPRDLAVQLIKIKPHQALLDPQTSKSVRKLRDDVERTYKKREKDLKEDKQREIEDLKRTQLKKIEDLKIESQSRLKKCEEEGVAMCNKTERVGEELVKQTEKVYMNQYKDHVIKNTIIKEECISISDQAIQESLEEKREIQTTVFNLQKEVDEAKWRFENLTSEIDNCEEDKSNTNHNNEIQNKIKHNDKKSRDYVTSNKIKKEIVKIKKHLLRKQQTMISEQTRKETTKRQFENDHFTYNLTIIKSRETIETLSKRLLESDRDVEQFKEELNQVESKNALIEEKIVHLNQNLESLTKHNEDLSLEKTSVTKLCQNEIVEFEKTLLKTVDNYKNQVSEMMKTYESRLKRTETDLEEVLQALYEQEGLNSEAFNLIHLANVEMEDLEKNKRMLEDRVCIVKTQLKKAENEIDRLKLSGKKLQEQLEYQERENDRLKLKIDEIKNNPTEVKTLTTQIAHLEKKNQTYSEYCIYYNKKANEYEKIVNDMNDINRNYIDQTKKYEDLLQKCEEIEHSNAKLQKLIGEKENLIAPFKDQLERYKMEWQALIIEKANAEHEAKTIGIKYAEMMGHQNQKQKIKHIVDLKEKNFNLFKENQAMESKLRAQTKMIEKLKSDLAKKSKKIAKKITGEYDNNAANKENSFCETYSSPLRDRNRDN